jgi:hypothetical protein
LVGRCGSRTLARAGGGPWHGGRGRAWPGRLLAAASQSTPNSSPGQDACQEIWRPPPIPSHTLLRAPFASALVRTPSDLINQDGRDDDRTDHDALKGVRNTCQHEGGIQNGNRQAPTRPPTTLPRPPDRLVPPITTAAIALSSAPAPAPVSATMNLAVSNIAATAEQRPLSR